MWRTSSPKPEAASREEPPGRERTSLEQCVPDRPFDISRISSGMNMKSTRGLCDCHKHTQGCGGTSGAECFARVSEVAPRQATIPGGDYSLLHRILHSDSSRMLEVRLPKSKIPGRFLFMTATSVCSDRATHRGFLTSSWSSGREREHGQHFLSGGHSWGESRSCFRPWREGEERGGADGFAVVGHETEEGGVPLLVDRYSGFGACKDSVEEVVG